MLNELKWKVVYRDYYGNESVVAAFAWLSDAEKYIAEKPLQAGRLELEEGYE